MKKCGIITYHFAVNYGAMLQCFALQKVLQMNGYQADVLNFISDKQNDNNSLYRKQQGMKGHLKNLLLLPFHTVRKKRQDKIWAFRKQQLGCSDRLKNLDALQKQIQSNGYDVLISGSDQVWNPNIFDFDPAFFFPFETSAKKSGYAVSIGNANEKDLEPYGKWIQQFDSITVRENASSRIIQAYSSTPTPEVVDPVFLLSSTFWKEITPPCAEREKYLLCYFVQSTKLDDKVALAKRIARQKNLKLIILSPRITKYNFKETVISDAGPMDFLSYFCSASFVCTDSFHGTAFSILFNRQFVTLEQKERHTDSRKRNLLQNVGLADHIHFLGDEYADRGPIDHCSVDQKLQYLRESSLMRLINNIESQQK